MLLNVIEVLFLLGQNLSTGVLDFQFASARLERGALDNKVRRQLLSRELLRVQVSAGLNDVHSDCAPIVK
jgi:hypothetical protein